jgi:hypothetical protein
MNKTKQGCLCVRPSVSSVCSSVTSDKVHVRPISKYSSIFEHIEHILENIHRICPLRLIPNRQNRPSVRPSCPSTTSLPPNMSDMTTLNGGWRFVLYKRSCIHYLGVGKALFLYIGQRTTSNSSSRGPCFNL